MGVRDPGSLPILFQRGMHDIIKREKEGSMHDKFMRAFNYLIKSLTDSGRIRQGTVDLTPKGVEREKEAAHLKDTKMKLYWLDRWATKLRAENPSLYAKTWWQARDEGGG
jgi:hypothetical protein